MASNKKNGPSDIVPSGSHRGERVRDLTNEALNAMVAGWNGCNRRNDPFFPVLVAEQTRRNGGKKHIEEPKPEFSRRTIRDDFALALLPIICELEIETDEGLDPMDPEDLERIVFEAYEKADLCLRVRERTERVEGANNAVRD